MLSRRHRHWRTGLGLWLLALATSFPSLGVGPAEGSCIAPLAYLPLDARLVGKDDRGTAALGTYERISPDGRFILRSYSGALLGKVSLVELPEGETGALQVHPTPLSNEAFPVQGSWRYLVDVTGEHYRFGDILRRGPKARPLFRGGMTGFYAAAAEMPVAITSPVDALPSTLHIRSLSWPQDADPDRQGVGPLQIATLEVRDDGQAARVLADTGPQYICSNRVSIDGNAFALPMLSVDGNEFSAIPQAPAQGQPSMRVYSLAATRSGAGPSCNLLADLGQSPSKAVFGFAQGSAPALLAYSDLGNVYLFDRALGQAFRIDHAMDDVLASAFPGLTRDGRIIYGATWRACPDRVRCPEVAGYVVADPYQSQSWRQYWQERGQPPPRACITHQQVRQERQRFAHWHGLAP